MPDTSNPEPVELVFVYGMLRKGASNHSRLKAAEHLGEATVRGHLLKISWFPALVLDPQSKTQVWGDLYQVKGAQLQAFREYEGLAGDAREGTDCRLVHARAQQVPASLGSLRVLLWEWTGDREGAELVTTGDWLDVECPKSAPFFTWIAGICTVSSPVAVAMVGKARDPLSGWFFFALAVIAPVSGWIALHWAGRRRERAELLQFIVVVALGFISVAAGIYFLMGMASLARDLSAL